MLPSESPTIQRNGPAGRPVKISVVMPTFNRLEQCAEALAHLINQDFDPTEYEIVIADDGSRDGTREYVTGLRTFPNLKYLRQEHRGVSATRNQGIREARGELILFVDDDVLATPRLLQEHYHAHQSNPNPKRVVLGYTPPLPRGNVREPIVRYYTAYWESVYRKAPVEIATSPQWYFITNNLSVRKAFLVEAGLFDEEFQNLTEDFELGYRLCGRGMELEYWPSAMAYHRFVIDLEVNIRKRFLVGLSAALFYRKHPEVKAAFSIDTATGDFDHPIGLPRRAWRRVKPLVYNDRVMDLLMQGIGTFGGWLPTKVTLKLITYLNWHHYLAGIRQGLKETEQAIHPRRS